MLLQKKTKYSENQPVLKYGISIVSTNKAELFGGVGVAGDQVAERQYDVVLEVIFNFLLLQFFNLFLNFLK